VWRFDPATNSTTPAADGFVKPNGVAFSPDFKVAYVTDTGAVDGTGAPAAFAAAAPAIYAFDVGLDEAKLPLLRNRRLFAVSPSGIPDGIKLDSQGNVYVGVPGGVDVFSAFGQALGSIAVGPTANLAFAGSELVMLQEGNITVLPMKVKGTQLPLQAPL
jgi:gluconolactonase